MKNMAAPAPIAASPIVGTTSARKAFDVVVNTRLNPMSEELWHMSEGIGSSWPRSTNVISAH